MVNVVDDYGASGNDSDDDTSAIQAAIDSLPLSPGGVNYSYSVGGTVYFPRGIYKITSPINIRAGVVLVGDGAATLI